MSNPAEKEFMSQNMDAETSKHPRMDWPLSTDERKRQIMQLYQKDVTVADSMLEQMSEELHVLRRRVSLSSVSTRSSLEEEEASFVQVQREHTTELPFHTNGHQFPSAPQPDIKAKLAEALEENERLKALLVTANSEEQRKRTEMEAQQASDTEASGTEASGTEDESSADRPASESSDDWNFSEQVCRPNQDENFTSWAALRKALRSLVARSSDCAIRKVEKRVGLSVRSNRVAEAEMSEVWESKGNFAFFLLQREQRQKKKTKRHCPVCGSRTPKKMMMKKNQKRNRK